jgi:hypothetical protein
MSRNPNQTKGKVSPNAVKAPKPIRMATQPKAVENHNGALEKDMAKAIGPTNRKERNTKLATKARDSILSPN